MNRFPGSIFLLTTLLIGGIALSGDFLPLLPPHDGAALDFDFKGVAGKSEFPDRTGNYKLISDTQPMLEEEGALRVSDSARLHIPCKDNAFGEQVTIAMWYLHTEAGNYMWETPLLESSLPHFVQ